MSVANICRPNVICAEKTSSALDAAVLMRENHVGSLIVVEEVGNKRRPIGILTDRDLVVEVCAADINPQDVTTGDIMSGELVTVCLDEDFFVAAKLMRTHRARRLPVVDKDGCLAGILSIDDVLDSIAEVLSDVAWLTMSERELERELRQ